MFHAVIKGAAGVRRVHITEEKEMTQENVCKSCEYYESCGKPGKTGKTKNGGKANGAGNGKRQGY